MSSLGRLAQDEISPLQFQALDALRLEIDPPAAALEPLAMADHEEALSSWLTAHGVERDWDLLHDTIAVCQPEETSEAEVLRRCAATWGTVYGIARLITLRQIPASVPADQSQLLHEAVDTLFDGWQANRPPAARTGPKPQK